MCDFLLPAGFNLMQMTVYQLIGLYKQAAGCVVVFDQRRVLNKLWLPLSVKQLSSLWDNTVTKSSAELRAENKAFFVSFFFYRPQSTAIYFNDGNEQCSRAGLLRHYLILPGGNMKRRGWPPQPELWKRQFCFFKSSFVYFCTSTQC